METWLCRLCHENNIVGITERKSSGGTPQKALYDRLLMLLWFLASVDKYSSIADRFGFSESTACMAIHNLVFFIQEYLLEKIIVWPNEEEQKFIEALYFGLKKFSGIVGCVDTSHVPVRRPRVRGIDYYNRKEFYSIILQLIVREDLRITDVYVGWPGKVHDARVFLNSPFYQEAESKCGDGHILGDSAYPNLPFLMRPFTDNGRLTPLETHYNVVHSSIRSIVERAIGLLKGRFKRLTYIDQWDVKVMNATILTGCVMHNMCIMKTDTFEELLVEDRIPLREHHVEDFDGNAQEVAKQKRRQIAEQLSA